MKTSVILLLCALVAFCVAEKLQASSVEVSSGDEEGSDLEVEMTKLFPGSCGLCKRFLKFVKKQLASGKTQKVIQRRLHKMCNKIPFLGSTCRKFVDANLKVMVEMLTNNVDIRAICVKVKACDKKSLLELTSYQRMEALLDEAMDQRMEHDLGMELDKYA